MTQQQRICLQCRRYRFDPWVKKIPGGGNSNSLQYSCLENSMNRGAWWATAQGVANSWTRVHTRLSSEHTTWLRGYRTPWPKSPSVHTSNFTSHSSLQGWQGNHLAWWFMLQQECFLLQTHHKKVLLCDKESLSTRMGTLCSRSSSREARITLRSKA